MRKRWKRKLNWISEHPIKFSVRVLAILVILYSICAYKFKLGMNMDASTAISTDIALITIIITSIGLSISGYIFLNGYFGTVVEGQRSLSSIIEGLNKTYIRKIIGASFSSMAFIAFAFIVIFRIKDAEEGNFSAFTSCWECVFQHLTYMGSIGSILYNFHFLCHIINPDKLIKKKAFKVVNEQMKFLVNEYGYLSLLDPDSGWEWSECRKFSVAEDSIGSYAGVSSDRTQQTLGIVKYIYEIETIITKVIELNALEGENRSEEEALKFVFADSHVGTVKYEKRMSKLSIDKFSHFHLGKGKALEKYESAMSELIEQYVIYYDRLVLLKNALIKMGKERAKDLEIKDEVKYFAALMMRVTLKLFSNFVKMTGLNVGGGYFTHAYLSYSDLSGSNLTGSDFSEARMEGSIFKGSDLSISKLDRACINDGDFRNVNLGYASLIGTECVCINLTNAKLTDIIFHSPAVIRRHEIIKERILNIFDNNFDLEKLGKCSADVVKDGKEIETKENAGKERITDLSAATLDNVVLKSIDLSVLKLSGASFDNSVLTNSLWLYTTKADGMKLRNANLRNVLVVQSNFSMSDFHASNLGTAFFIDVNMSQTNLNNVNGVSMRVYGSSEKIMLCSGEQEIFLSLNAPQFSNKDFKTSQITDERGFSKWVQVNFQNVNAVESQWHNTLLNESDFSCAILKNTIWENIGANWVNMEKCDMTYSTMSDVSFRMAKMTSCIFTRALLKNIDFEDANLYKANFIHAYIRDVRFIQCNLSCAIFSHTYFQNCRFFNCGMYDIYLQSTIFENVKFDCNSFLIVLNSYNESERVSFHSCEVRFDDERDYNKLYDKLQGEREIPIKWERYDDKILINMR